MGNSTLTELALRTAANTSSQNISSDDGDSASDIKSVALKRMQELLGGEGSTTNISSQSSLEAAAIAAAVKGLELAFFTISKQLAELKYKRVEFEKESEAGIATFIIPTNKEEADLSKQERVIKAFIDLVNNTPFFSPYFGIKIGTSKELPHANLYSVLPFYKMSNALTQPIASTKAIDKERISINLFFNSDVPEVIEYIDNNFQAHFKFIEWCKSITEKTNYLNDLRSRRFIVICLANLLWNLQHPVNPETGFSLSVDKRIALCQAAGIFLNKILNSVDKAYVYGLNGANIDLVSYARRVEIHIKKLQDGFVKEQLNELNISDVINSAHCTLRTIDKSVFQLICRKKNFVTKKWEPDDKAAETLASIISVLSHFFNYNSDLIIPFNKFITAAKETPFLNNPPSTLIDAFIIFIHCTSDQKRKIFEELERNPSESAIEFKYSLKKLNERFIRPIKEVCKKELKVTYFDPKRKEVAYLLARRLIPLITLVVEDYRVDIDSPITAKESQKTSGTNIKGLRATEQVQAINKQAAQANNYYIWELSPFIELNKDTEDELDKLPKHQYRFTEITKLLDAVGEIVISYRTFLQLKPFQNFLVKCLNKIRQEYDELASHIERVDTYLSKDKSISRAMQAVLVPMTKEIGKGLDNFLSAFSAFEHTVSAPDFTDQQKLNLSIKIESIHQQFASLFNEDSGILIFSDMAEESTLIRDEKASNEDGLPPLKHLIAHPCTTEQPAMCSPKQIVALRTLINDCLNAASLQSHYSLKGTLLHNILKLVDDSSSITPEQLSTILKELARITLSYRPTYFFQAAYGETRSAKVLIAKIKDEAFNKILPISSILLDREEIAGISNVEIIQYFRGHRSQRKWEESCDEISPISAL